MFRSLLVDNPLRFLISPVLGALGGVASWCLFALLLAVYADNQGVGVDLLQRENPAFYNAAYFACIGLCVGFACNMLRVIQDGQGPLRVAGAGLLSGLIAGMGGLVGGLAIHLVVETAGTTVSDLLPLVGCYLVVGLLVGLSSRITTFDRFTLLGALGGLLGGGVAVGLRLGLARWDIDEAYATLLIPMILGFGIGLVTYSLPSFVSGASLRILTGNFRGQTKELENRDIVIGNNKRRLQWVLPKWEGVQDPHACIEVRADGRGYRHWVKNLSRKAVVVLRSGKRNRVRGEDAVELEDGDVLVFATGKNYVKVRYTQRTENG
ncbi:MAG: FHA domain-containing protein [Myxococcota bacterium]|nr:FHA domain-containing protein [Myxococcota bacterium]